MASVAFAFGSVGDILAVIELALEVRKALSESRGSSKEYQEIQAELDSFTDVLASTCATLSSLPSTQLTDPLRRSIRLTMDSLKEVLGEIYASIAKYHTGLRKEGSGSVWQDRWLQLRWYSGKKKETITAMKHKLNDYVGRLNLLLLALQW